MTILITDKNALLPKKGDVMRHSTAFFEREILIDDVHLVEYDDISRTVEVSGFVRKSKFKR